MGSSSREPLLIRAALHTALWIIKLSAPLGNYVNDGSAFLKTFGLR